MRLANILTTDPKTGWRRFLFGFSLFIAGLVVTLSTLSEQLLFEWIGLITMLLGFVLAMSGYLPMLLHRLGSAKRRAKQYDPDLFAKSSHGTKPNPKSLL